MLQRLNDLDVDAVESVKRANFKLGDYQQGLNYGLMALVMLQDRYPNGHRDMAPLCAELGDAYTNLGD